MALDNNEINNVFKFFSGNAIKEMKEVQMAQNNLINSTKTFEIEIDKLGNKKIKLSVDSSEMQTKIMKASQSIKSLSSESIDAMSNINGAISKLDNNSSSRGKKDFSKIYDAVGSYASRFAETVLPSSLGSAVSGAISGGSIGFSVGGPVGAVAGAIIGAGSEFALSEVKKETDKKKQRIRFSSNIITSYLPKIAMSSLSYASNMEQSRINYENILGIDKGNAFVDKMLEVSGKGFYEYSDLSNAGKQMILAGMGEDQIFNIFGAAGNASSAKGAGKEGALQMVEALKNMQTVGKVTLDNMDIFEKIGVDAYSILADSIKIAGKDTKTTKEELKELISKGVVPADEAITNLINGMNYKYAGMMRKQRQGFSSLISTIKSGANQIILGPLGKGFIEGIKPALASFSSFFGLGTKGFKDLSEQIYNFGTEIGKFAGSAIDNFKNIFGELFNDENFKNSSLTGKIKLVLGRINEEADEWYKTGGKDLIDNITGFFTDLYEQAATDSEFLKAVQNLWLSIAPDEDTLKTIINNVFWKGIVASLKEELNSFLSSPFEYISKTTLPAFPLIIPTLPSFGPNAIGLNRVPYDYYPALLHEGEAVLRRTEADNYRNGVGKGVIISKIADTIVVKDETDMYKLADILVSEIEKAGLVYGGAM